MADSILPNPSMASDFESLHGRSFKQDPIGAWSRTSLRKNRASDVAWAFAQLQAGTSNPQRR
ncbi:MAG: hypothetical protein WAN87_04375 [Thermoplasmata archaeon]